MNSLNIINLRKDTLLEEYIMAVVDVDYEVYKCPHCDGFIWLRRQFADAYGGCSTLLEHSMSNNPEGIGTEGTELEEIDYS